MKMKPDVSIVVSTYNRAKTLVSTMDSLLDQRDFPNYEVVVVDNNSMDETRELVCNYAHKSQRVRYVFEKKQGLSYGRNTGISAAESDLIAFTDDNVRANPDWVQQIQLASMERPDYGIFGGRVLPLWPHEPPSWLMKEHWAPLALCDYGQAQTISSANRKTLIGANMIIRRSVFDQIGMFSPDYQRVGEGVGSTEDHELQNRYWKAGGLGWFDPSIVVKADVQPERLEKQYHRRWHFAHGRMLARMRDPMIEDSTHLIFGIPRYMFRELISRSCNWVGAISAGKPDTAFLHETELRFYAGFIRERLTERRAQGLSASSMEGAD